MVDFVKIHVNKEDLSHGCLNYIQTHFVLLKHWTNPVVLLDHNMFWPLGGDFRLPRNAGKSPFAHYVCIRPWRAGNLLPNPQNIPEARRATFSWVWISINKDRIRRYTEIELAKINTFFLNKELYTWKDPSESPSTDVTVTSPNNFSETNRLGKRSFSAKKSRQETKNRVRIPAISPAR